MVKILLDFLVVNLFLCFSCYNHSCLANSVSALPVTHSEVYSYTVCIKIVATENIVRT